MKTSNELFAIATSDLATVAGGQPDHDPASPTQGGPIARAVRDVIDRYLATRSAAPTPIPLHGYY